MSMDEIRCVGLSHKTASIDVRESIAFEGEDEVKQMLKILMNQGVKEVVLLSTCNRTEIYYIPIKEGFEVRERIVQSLADFKGVRRDSFSPFLYDMAGIEAVRHLYRVASSMDSMVVGEPQVLGQVKEAWRWAKDANCIGTTLNRIFERAFKISKEIRTVTKIGFGGVSIGSIAVDLAKKVFGSLSRVTVLLIGAGKMAEAVAKALSFAGAMKVMVANRTIDRAHKVADRFAWGSADLSDIVSLVAQSDVVIASVYAPDYLITSQLMEKVIRMRRGRAIFLIDIGVPRVIDPEVSKMDGVYAYNIDDFNEIVKEHLSKRSQDLGKAEEIISMEIEKFIRFQRETKVEPLISALYAKANEIKDRELTKTLNEIKGLDEEGKKAIEAMAKAIITKILHDPVNVIRSSAAQGKDEIADMCRELFCVKEVSSEDCHRHEGE